MENLNPAMFEEYVLTTSASVIFCSRKGCHVCQGIHPLLDELEQEFQQSNVGFYHLDVEEQPLLFQTLHGKGVPQVLYYHYGEILERFVGEHSLDEYAYRLSQILEEKK